ncbi:MAG: TAXI family TRAP transporter solute-binding subunit [Betaproteobacteria bacterium]|nr:MAG: TAXI family TRAP transporter solute-binding subunit [Betaproteobacteria bacterium]
MIVVRILVMLLLTLVATGCQRGPDAETLRKHVETRLGEALPADTLTLVSIERRGSQSDSKAPPDMTRRIVYFDAELKLGRDYEFGAWDGPGVAGLVSALGAGPKGIAGIASGGNKAGDVVRARGSAVYRLDGDAWVPVVAGGYSPAVAPAYASNEPRGPARVLDAMRKIIDSVPMDGSPAHREAIEEELVAAHAAIRARLARISDGYGIAAGPENGQYLRFVQALSAAGKIRTVPLITRGGEENLRLLRGEKVALALAQGDAALDAYAGRASFADEGPYTTLRAVGSLYPEPVHVLVSADSKLGSLTDLKGRRVAVGEQGSASRTTALRVLQAHQIAPTDITALDLPLREALLRLRRKEVDAVVQVIGVPADSIREAVANVPLRLLPLSQAAVDRLVEAKTGYFAFTIVHGTYANQKDDVRTVATAALLLAGATLSDTEVVRIARHVFDGGHDFAVRGSAQGTQVSASTARNGLSIPLHAAVAKALDEMAVK